MIKQGTILTLAVLLLLSLMPIVGAQTQIYWSDNCESANGWNPTLGTYLNINGDPSTFTLYNGDFHDGSSCFRLTSTGRYQGPDSITETKYLNTTITPIDGKYSYCIGGWVKVKQLGSNVGRADASGYASIGIIGQSGMVINSFVFAFDNTGQGGYRSVSLPYQGPSVPLNSWHEVKMLVTPQNTTYYLDGVVSYNTNTVLNDQPVGFQISVYSGWGGVPIGNGLTDVYFDGLYVSAPPAPQSIQTFPWLIVLVIAFVIWLVMKK